MLLSQLPRLPLGLRKLNDINRAADLVLTLLVLSPAHVPYSLRTSQKPPAVFWENFLPRRKRTGLGQDRYKLDNRFPEFVGPLVKFCGKANQMNDLELHLGVKRTWTLQPHPANRSMKFAGARELAKIGDEGE